MYCICFVLLARCLPRKGHIRHLSSRFKSIAYSITDSSIETTVFV